MTTRVTIDLSPAEHELLGRVAQQLGLSKNSVFKDALRSLELFVETVRQGDEVFEKSTKDGVVQWNYLPILGARLKP